MKPQLIVLTGPTAVGKTKLSIMLAKKLSGEIISADSMQIYKHMDIGSAKVTTEEMDGVVHHMIDVLSPLDECNVSKFQTLCKEAIQGILERGHIPILVGGTGFYIQAILKDVDFAKTQVSDLRKKLEQEAEEKGACYLHEKLRQIDQVAAEQIHANNVKRVIRAIEYFEETGQPISAHNAQQKENESPYDYSYYVLTMDRDALYERIEQRIDQMLENGLVNEVKALKQMGCMKGMTSMQGLGYKEILDYLDGRCTYEEAVYLLKRDTRRFAKRQLTWFRREEDVIWIDKDAFGHDDTAICEFIMTQEENKRR